MSLDLVRPTSGDNRHPVWSGLPSVSIGRERVLLCAMRSVGDFLRYPALNLGVRNRPSESRKRGSGAGRSVAFSLCAVEYSAISSDITSTGLL